MFPAADAIAGDGVVVREWGVVQGADRALGHDLIVVQVLMDFEEVIRIVQLQGEAESFQELFEHDATLLGQLFHGRLQVGDLSCWVGWTVLVVHELGEK